MRKPPDGWSLVTLGSVAESVRNGLFARRPNDLGDGERILRISSVRGGVVNVDDSRYVAGVPAEKVGRFAVAPGDLLMTRYNGSRHLVGISGLVPTHEGNLLHPDKLIRVVVNSRVAEPKFLNYQLGAHSVRAFLEPRIRTTAGQSGISGHDVREIPIALPSLAEQRRIVDILEDHVSRLDAAEDYARTAARRGKVLVKSVLLDLVPDVSAYPSRWEHSTVESAGQIGLGRQRHPDWHTGPNMRPYLRVANVFEDRIDTSDIMQMHWPDHTFERFKLHPGDVLLNEGQTPELLGRPAIYRGLPEDVAFTNSLLRFRAHENVLPEYALLVFRRHMHAGRFAREARITTNIAHLSASRLKPIEFPIPPILEQEAILDVARDRLDSVSALQRDMTALRLRSDALRRGLLSAAFSGMLTGRRTDHEVIEELASA